MVSATSLKEKRGRRYLVDTTASDGSSTATVYYETCDDYGDYYVCSTRRTSAQYDELIKSIKSKKVYPWETEPPKLKFINFKKKDIVPRVFDKKMFVNSYKSARSSM
jgi:hypothetical protein